MTNSSRKIWVDNARGIGILIIFMIHSVPSAVRADSMIARNIYDIGMFIGRQLFFLLAGYTFQLTLQKKNKFLLVITMRNLLKNTKFKKTIF